MSDWIVVALLLASKRGRMIKGEALERTTRHNNNAGVIDNLACKLSQPGPPLVVDIRCCSGENDVMCWENDKSDDGGGAYSMCLDCK